MNGVEIQSANGTLPSASQNDHRLLGLIDGLEQRTVMVAPGTDPGDERRRRLALISSEEFLRKEYRHEWLVKDILVKGQPAVLGGPRKALKTSFLIDLAISLAARPPLPVRFLGRFEVPAPVRVGLFSGESGAATIQETALRISQARGTTLATSGIFWNFSVPHLAEPLDLGFLQQQIRDQQLDVVIVDPLYLALPGGGGADTNNLFAMGSLLTEAAQVCLEAGATPILAHHARKHRPTDERWEPLELEDLAFAGIQEFARQWILLSRRERFVPGTGLHRLWMSVGGSAGFGGLWGVDVNEAPITDNGSTRTWRVRVIGVEEARTQARQARALQKESDQASRNDRLRECIVDHLRAHPDGDTRSAIATALGVNARVSNPVFDAMLAEGILKKVVINKGRGTRTYDGLALATGVRPGHDADEGE
jgi:hypothetical protein